MKPLLIGAGCAILWCLAVVVLVYLQRICAERRRWRDWHQGRGA